MHATHPRTHPRTQSSTATVAQQAQHRKLHGRHDRQLKACNRTRRTTRTDGAKTKGSHPPFTHPSPTFHPPVQSTSFTSATTFLSPRFPPQLPPHLWHHHHITVFLSSAKKQIQAPTESPLSIQQTSNRLVAQDFAHPPRVSSVSPGFFRFLVASQ